MANRPMPNIRTNVGGSHMGAIDNISSRNYNLRPTVNPGGFDAVPSIPLMYRENEIQELDMHKTNMRKSI